MLHSTEEKIAEKQIKLENKIMKLFGVKKPFIPFSKHEYLKGISSLKKGERFNEMVLYPNIQDALFFGRPFPIAEAIAKVDNGEWKNMSWPDRLKQLNIKVIDKTVQEFKHHHEKMGKL